MITARISAFALAFAVAACTPYEPSARDIEAEKSAQAAQTIDFSAGNAERDNIVKRSELVAQPDLVGFVVLLNFGQPIAYYQVKGKITSSGKRLEVPQEYRYLRSRCYTSGDTECGGYFTGPAPSYDGTYGDSDKYIYFWTTNGQYVQWSGDYIYSDQPLNLSVSGAKSIVSDK